MYTWILSIDKGKKYFLNFFFFSPLSLELLSLSLTDTYTHVVHLLTLVLILRVFYFSYESYRIEQKNTYLGQGKK